MKKLIIIFSGMLFLGLFTTQVSAAEKTTFAFYEEWGLGYFDENAKFVPRDEIPKEELNSYPYGWNSMAGNMHMLEESEPVPFVRYDESQKKTGYWSNYKFGKYTNKERFIEVKYPKNSGSISKFVHGPFVYKGNLCYIPVVDNIYGYGEKVYLPEEKVDISQYPVLHRYNPIIIGANGLEDLQRQIWYVDKEGTKFEFTDGAVGHIREKTRPDGGNAEDVGQSKGTIILELDDKLISIPDITDPNRPLSPDTPNEINSKSIASELNLTQYPQNFNFGSRKISSKENQAVYTVNQEPSSKTGEKEGIQVYDGRLTEQGYSVTAEFTGFQSNGKESLKGASIELADKKTSLSLTDASKFSAQQKGFSLSKDTATTTILETNNAKFFTGNYWDESDVQLIIPRGSIVIGAHEGVVEWTLQTKPNV